MSALQSSYPIRMAICNKENTLCLIFNMLLFKDSFLSITSGNQDTDIVASKLFLCVLTY